MLKFSCRKDSNAEKYKLRKQLFNTEDLEPLWVADMDISYILSLA